MFGVLWRRSQSKFQGPGGYHLLSASEWGSTPGIVGSASWLRRRRKLVALILLVFVSTVGCLVYYFVHHPEFWRRTAVLKVIGPPSLPPLYPEFREQEAVLPQHDARHAFAGGCKYLWVASHTSWSGWGNFMQDMVLTAQLTYVTGRAYVFDDYTWDRDGVEYSKFGDKLIPSRIPLSAIISGPIAGGQFLDGDATPPAITKSHWDKICPNPRIVQGEDVRAIHGSGASALKITETWRDYLANIEDPCVEVPRESGNIFHIFMFGNKEEMLPIWPTLSRSPILTLFGWSTLAHAAFEANRGLFSPAPLIEPYVTAPACPHCIDPYEPLPGLLAIHLRRGDFIEHCPNLCRWGAGFNAFNSFPDFPDQWQAPQGTEEERMDVYLKRCVPTIPQVVEKVEAVRDSAAGEGLKDIYIMTNGDEEWLAQLKTALRGAHNWEHIATSRDMAWTPEQKYVAQSTDMMVGQRAQVFIGNGHVVKHCDAASVERRASRQYTDVVERCMSTPAVMIT